MTDTPLEQAKQHGEQAQKHAGEARAKLETVEREADELARRAADPTRGPVEIYAARWANTIAAGQVHATLALSERVAAVAGLLGGLVTPRPVADGSGPLSGSGDLGAMAVQMVSGDFEVEWQWFDCGPSGIGAWLAARSEADADTLAGSHGRVRSHVVGAWHERPAR